MGLKRTFRRRAILKFGRQPPPENHMAQRSMGFRAIAVITRPRSAITMATWTVQNAIFAPRNRCSVSGPNKPRGPIPARNAPRDRAGPSGMSTVVCVPLFFGSFQYGGLVTWTCEFCFEVDRQTGRRYASSGHRRAARARVRARRRRPRPPPPPRCIGDRSRHHRCRRRAARAYASTSPSLPGGAARPDARST